MKDLVLEIQRKIGEEPKKVKSPMESEVWKNFKNEKQEMIQFLSS